MAENIVVCIDTSIIKTVRSYVPPDADGILHMHTVTSNIMEPLLVSTFQAIHG